MAATAVTILLQRLKQTVQFAEITQHIFCSLIIGHAFWREFDPSRGALEKLGAKLMFQLPVFWRETLPFGKAKKSAAREKLSSSATLMNNCIA